MSKDNEKTMVDMSRDIVQDIIQTLLGLALIGTFYVGVLIVLGVLGLASV